MLKKWRSYHLAFFLIMFGYNYVFNYLFSIPKGKEISLTASFIVYNGCIVAYFYTVYALSKRVVLTYLIPLLVLLLAVGTFALALIPFGFKIQLSIPITFTECFFFTLFDTAFFTISALAFLFLEKWKESKDQNMELIKVSEEAELTFLRTQMSPHFLLNTLNTLYSLSLTNPSEVSSTIQELKNIFSFLHRNKESISIKEEILYLENYIKIQKRRFGKFLKITISIECDGEYQIEPLMLSPFIENAFKHGVSSKYDCFIDLRLQIQNGQLTYRVQNSDIGILSKDKTSGIGLQNLSRRLALLYSNRHSLTYLSEKGIYTAQLNLKLA